MDPIWKNFLNPRMILTIPSKASINTMVKKANTNSHWSGWSSRSELIWDILVCTCTFPVSIIWFCHSKNYQTDICWNLSKSWNVLCFSGTKVYRPPDWCSSVISAKTYRVRCPWGRHCAVGTDKTVKEKETR